MPKPPIYITDVKNISPLIRLLKKIAKQQFEIKALADNQVKVQPKTSESYRKIMKALAEKCMLVQAYKLKKERSYRVMLKNMYYYINPEEIKT
jgi:phosphoenolpyruvate carboxylase